MRLTFLFGEIAGGLRRNVAMVVSVVLVSMVSLLFLGAGLLAQRQVDVAKGYWYDKVQVSVFLCTESSGDVPSCADGAATDQQRAQIKSDLESLRPLVKQVYFEDSEQAYRRFQQQFRNSPNLSAVTPGSIPAAYRVKLSDPGRVGEIVSALQGAPGVEAVSDQRRALKTFFDILRMLSIGAVALAAVMLVCAVLLISTTIRQVAWSRRKQVRIMRSVGASSAVVQLPFLVETVLAVLVGALLAVGLLWAGVHYGLDRFAGSEGAGLVSLIGDHDVWVIAPWLVGGGVLVAAVTSWLTLRRHLRV